LITGEFFEKPRNTPSPSSRQLISPSPLFTLNSYAFSSPPSLPLSPLLFPSTLPQHPHLCSSQPLPSFFPLAPTF
jgi:hypothetical protein